MRAPRPFRLLVAVLALMVLGWLLLPGARGPGQNPGSGPEAATRQQAPDLTRAPGERTQSPPRAASTQAGRSGQASTLPDFLPPEAAAVIGTIQHGGRFPHRQDGSVFGNRERHLPQHAHGYYREYTVPTPGLSHRGARRIVTGGDPPRHWYYTDDHYDSFRAFQPAPAEAAR